MKFKLTFKSSSTVSSSPPHLASFPLLIHMCPVLSSLWCLTILPTRLYRPCKYGYGWLCLSLMALLPLLKDWVLSQWNITERNAQSRNKRALSNWLPFLPSGWATTHTPDSEPATELRIDCLTDYLSRAQLSSLPPSKHASRTHIHTRDINPTDLNIMEGNHFQVLSDIEVIETPFPS